MALTNIKITNFVTGDSWRIKRTYSELPTGVTITKVYFTVKAEKNNADPGLIQVDISAALTSKGQITDSSTSDGIIEFYVDVLDTESSTLTPEVTYYYDLQGISSTGAVYTFEIGQIIPQRGVTDADS